MRRLLMAISFVLLPALAHSSATYYVAKTGSDSNTCLQAQSASSPKLTIAGSNGGLTCVAAGSTLIVKAGTYAEFIDRRQIPSGISWDIATTVKATPGDTVILQPTSGGTAGDAVWFYGQSYIILDGLTIDAASVSVQGIRFSTDNGNGSHHIRLQNTEVKNAPLSNCIGVQSEKEHDLQFINVKVHNCGNSFTGSPKAHGFYLRGSNHVVERSESYNNAGAGVQVYDTTIVNNNNTIRDSVFHDNGSVGITLTSGTNNVAYNNIVYGNSQSYSGAGIYVNWGATSNQVYNNTIYNNNGYCVHVGEASTNAVVENNICWQNAYAAIYNIGKGSVIAYNLMTDPLFVDSSGKNFQLQTGSPAINTGVAIGIVSDDYAGTLRPQGPTYDLGAYEYTGGVSPPSAAPSAPSNLTVSGTQ